MLSYVLLSIPLFGVLYFRGIPNGTWPIALGAHLLTVVLAAAAYLRFRSLFIGVSLTAVHERGLLGRVTAVPLARVHRAIIVSTYRSSSTETTQQLMLCDADNRRLVRMRGVFWTESAMLAVARASGVPLEETTDPLTARAFFEEYPGSAYWFENRPVLTVLAVIVVLAAVLALVLGLMALMGIPTGNTL